MKKYPPLVVDIDLEPSSLALADDVAHDISQRALLGLETAGEAAKRMCPQLFETAGEAAKRTHPQWFETAAETAKRTHPNLFESAAGIAARAILDKPISSYAHLNAFLAPTGVDIVGRYEAKQKAELQSLLNSISGVAARQASEKIVLASAAWMPINEWPEVKPRFLGMDLHSAIEADDSVEIERIMNDPAFGPEVLKAMHRAAKMSAEDQEAIKQELEEANQTQIVIKTIVSHVGVAAMAKARRLFSDEDKERIRCDAAEKKKKNPALSESAIHQQLATSYSASTSTMRRILKEK